MSQTHTPIPTPVPSGANGIIGFVSGLVAMALLLSIVGAAISMLFALLALLCGLIGRHESRKLGAPYGGLARAGWIMGSFVLVVWLLIAPYVFPAG